MKLAKKILIIGMIAFCCIGILFTGVFIAMQFGWLNVRGTIAERNNSIYGASLPIKNKPVSNDDSQAVILCKIHALSNMAPETARNIYNTYRFHG
jgi:hypothetical protein